MSLLHKINTFIHNPLILGEKIVLTTYWLWTDELYLRLLYFFKMKKLLRLRNPLTYNEKLQWLKLNFHNPIYTKFVDKYEVKKYVADCIGEEHVAKLFAHWDRVEDVKFDDLPDSFVVKTTHGGGNNGIVIVKNKNLANLEGIRKKLEKAMKYDLYNTSKEWPYKNINKRIIAEEYLEDLETGELRDYKFFCFNGVVKAILVATERQTRDEPFFNYFDENYSELGFVQLHPKAIITPPKPECFEEMKFVAEKLSAGFPHVRVDLYQCNGKVYFGEMTFYHHGGFVAFHPKEWDFIFGSWLQLPEVKVR